MSVIEFAERRLNDPNNAYHDQSYWRAYLDGALAQESEDATKIGEIVKAEIEKIKEDQQ